MHVYKSEEIPIRETSERRLVSSDGDAFDPAERPRRGSCGRATRASWWRALACRRYCISRRRRAVLRAIISSRVAWSVDPWMVSRGLPSAHRGPVGSPWILRLRTRARVTHRHVDAVTCEDLCRHIYRPHTRIRPRTKTLPVALPHAARPRSSLHGQRCGDAARSACGSASHGSSER